MPVCSQFSPQSLGATDLFCMNMFYFYPEYRYYCTEDKAVLI